MSLSAASSALSEIKNHETTPLAMFKNLLARLEKPCSVPMNIATVDSEFGVLNRTVMYRGIVDDCLVFVTERNSRKYKNLKENPRIAMTLLIPELQEEDTENGPTVETWQVRLFDAMVQELEETQLAEFWAEEPPFARIRSNISDCGKPIERDVYAKQHDALMTDYESHRVQLEQTKTYTAFKIMAKRWDFYKAETGRIADRLQYRKEDSNDGKEKWSILHVAP